MNSVFTNPSTKPCFNTAFDAERLTPAIIELRKKDAKGFNYKNYNPVFGWVDKYKAIKALAEANPDKLVIRYALHKDPTVEVDDPLILHKGIGHYNKLGLKSTISALTDTLYSYCLSGTMMDDLELTEIQNIVMCQMIGNNLFRSKRGYSRFIDFRSGHISKEHGYVVSSGMNIDEGMFFKTVNELIDMGYLIRYSDKGEITNYRYRGMSDIVVMLPLLHVIHYKIDYELAITDKPTLPPAIKSALSRGMLMHTTSLLGSFPQTRIMYKLFNMVTHYGQTELIVKKHGLHKELGLSLDCVKSAFKVLTNKGLLVQVDNGDIRKNTPKQYDMPIFPFDVKKGDISHYLFDHLEAFKNFGENIAEASSVLFTLRDASHDALYNKIRGLRKDGQDESVFALEADITLPENMFKEEVKEEDCGNFKKLYDVVAEDAVSWLSKKGWPSDPNLILNTYSFFKKGVIRKDNTTSYSPFTGERLGIDPEQALSSVKSAIKDGRLPLLPNSITKLLLGVHDLMVEDYCSGKPSKLKSRYSKEKVPVGRGTVPVTAMLEFLEASFKKNKQKISTYSHQYPTAVLANYRLTDIEEIWDFLFKIKNIKHYKRAMNKAYIHNPYSKGLPFRRGCEHSFAALVMMALTIETKFADLHGGLDVRLPVGETLANLQTAFVHGWHKVPELGPFHKERQEIDDMQACLKSMAHIKAQSMKAQRIVNFQTRDGQLYDGDYMGCFETVSSFLASSLGKVNKLGLYASLPAQTTVNMFERSPMIRGHIYNNDVELRSSYAFNYLLNMADSQTFGTLKHHLEKYFAKRYKFISICDLGKMSDDVKRAVGIRLDAMVELPFDTFEVVNHTQENRSFYNKYGKNMFDTYAKKAIASTMDDYIDELVGIRQNGVVLDEVFNMFKEISLAAVVTKTEKLTSKYYSSLREETIINKDLIETTKIVNYNLPSNLLSVLTASARANVLENGQDSVRYGLVDKYLVQSLTDRYGEDISSVSELAQRHIDTNLQFTMTGDRMVNKYKFSYLWEMPHVIEKLNGKTNFTGNVVAKKRDVACI